MKKGTRFNPAQVVLLGFLSFILIGTVLLLLPLSTPAGISPVDAFFTATSAVCVTGLIVKDTPHDFSAFGQVVILLLIQIGGFGYMTSATVISLLVGKRIGLGERLAMKEELNVMSLEGLVRFTKAVLLATVIFEVAGTVILTLRFSADFEFGQALYYGIFHSISAFNNAGFSLFSDSMIGYRGDYVINIVVSALVISGGIGFVVMSELSSRIRKRLALLSLHTKVVLSATGGLLVLGAVTMFIFEFSQPAFQGMGWGEKMLASFFGSMTPRTAGFNTLDYSQLSQPTLYLTMILMFIGGSPGSTAGGVKVTTVIIFFAGLFAMMRGSRDTVLFKRRVPLEIMSKSVLIVALAILLVALSFMFLISQEGHNSLSTLFEVVSASGTVGLSVGDGGALSFSALLTPLGKLIICFAMFAGRLGPLTLAYSVIKKKEERFRYPEGRVIVG